MTNPYESSSAIESEDCVQAEVVEDATTIARREFLWRYIGASFVGAVTGSTMGIVEEVQNSRDMKKPLSPIRATTNGMQKGVIYAMSFPVARFILETLKGRKNIKQEMKE